MYRKIDDFVQDWKAETSATLKIFTNISDEVKSNRVGENIRSLARLAWHITQTLTEMPSRSGLIDRDELEGQEIPDSIEKIKELYQKHSNVLLQNISERWNDSDLTGMIEVYGQPWERRKVLSVLVLHQAHHRGQMTILMRMENLPVPGIYGPSKEEWSKFGMKAME